ncbi:acyltransferase [Tropicimonas sp. TH_r6]|uniref:acyltransferase n=1 Tax=Tropicimonas sp. TH_r6 TaxID=3082085 RepID=UPI002953AE9A|nr:acyltransferase [Tropicimonas sp. TH_r6]MDV7145540.1 acyltransferase [Tropicimonas sp. TH_r6]
MARSLNKLKWLRRRVIAAKRAYLTRIWGMDIHPTVEMSLSATFDKTHPAGVHVGAHSYIAFDARILTHDMTRNTRRHTRIGENCFIGGRSLILPGVEIGDSCIVGAGSVVTKSVPSGSIVAGNPARVLRSGLQLLTYGRIPPEDRKPEPAASDPVHMAEPVA